MDITLSRTQWVIFPQLLLKQTLQCPYKSKDLIHWSSNSSSWIRFLTICDSLLSTTTSPICQYSLDKAMPPLPESYDNLSEPASLRQCESPYLWCLQTSSIAKFFLDLWPQHLQLRFCHFILLLNISCIQKSLSSQLPRSVICCKSVNTSKSAKFHTHLDKHTYTTNKKQGLQASPFLQTIEGQANQIPNLNDFPMNLMEADKIIMTPAPLFLSKVPAYTVP